jgi:eukaryotic-like serine/threonine-protein kinase
MSTRTLGKYRLIAELGRGGMAEVYLAVSGAPLNFTKLVVIKKLREHLAGDMDFVTMLVDEARIAARLNHPNLVQTLEMGEADGEYFLTMEYLDGQPLHRLLHRAKGRVPLNVHLTILSDVLRGIDYAHNLKDYDGTPLDIVHRDVTPHNVFVTYEGLTKVVDFGIAKAAGRISETRHGVVKGKTAYMALEQALGRHIDRRVDVFAVGVMIYEAAIKGRMWKGVPDTDIVRRLVSGQVPSSPKNVVPTVDDELDAICQRALAPRADDRYQTAAELQADLDVYLTRIGRATRDDVSAVMTSVFAETRASTNAIIEKQLAALKDLARRGSMDDIRRTGGGGARPDIMSSGSAPRSEAPPESVVPITPPMQQRPPQQQQPQHPHHPHSQHSQHSQQSQQQPYYPGARPVHGPPPMAPRVDPVSIVRANPASFLPLIIVTVVLAVASALATVTAVTMLTNRDGSKVPPPPPTAAKKETVTVTLRATPLETHFTVDDGPPLENPYVGTFEADGKPHRIRADAPGFIPQVTTATFDRDVSLRLSLAAARPVPSTAPSHKK